MTDKLKLYNGALAILGETPLASLSEDRAARYWLDRAWADGVVDYCLEQGQWHFATRTQQLTQSTSIIPAFNSWNFAFQLPDDFFGLNSLWLDRLFRQPLFEYDIEDGIIYAQWNTIYLKYVSNDPNFGYNLAAWPNAFAQYVEARLASESQPNITNSEQLRNRIEKLEATSRLTALNNDKRDKPLDRNPLGDWSRSRLYGYGFNGFGENGGNC